jgi:hypothetical protein
MADCQARNCNNEGDFLALRVDSITWLCSLHYDEYEALHHVDGKPWEVALSILCD